MDIYLSQLSGAVNEEELRRLFGVFGRVTSVTVVRDRVTHAPTGFAIVQMPDTKEAEMATASMNHKILKGQAVVVNKNRPHFEHH
jgi:RNA recognition motif-containing protein